MIPTISFLLAMGAVGAEDVSQIKEAEAQVDAANKKLNALKQKVNLIRRFEDC